MDLKNKRGPDKDVHVALELFLALHETPTEATAEKLIIWLQKGPFHVQAFDTALTVWALAGAALIRGPLTQEDELTH
ncbi:MAG: hypothetical protein B0W54_05110 [Cellvibrio sp. 79]|nr:MAG: hypothetical protein B0W54_05110 [Cellvibrio sp. 79]